MLCLKPVGQLNKQVLLENRNYVYKQVQLAIALLVRLASVPDVAVYN
jgi:hypothetical protein